MAYRAQIFLVSLCLVLAGCGGGDSQNEAEPKVFEENSEGHPIEWTSLHGVEVVSDLEECQICHGVNFEGTENAGSCFNCHVSGPPFGIHPAGWSNVIEDHKEFSKELSWTNCAVAICHGIDLQGGDNGPTCFNLSCHTNTAGDPPSPASHQGGDFSSPVNHGPFAKVSQAICLNCHARPDNVAEGGFISDPAIMNDLDFNGNVIVGSCKTCHLHAGAHPTNWQGENDTNPTYVSNHQDIDQTVQTLNCALCHDVNGSVVNAIDSAPSCFSESHTNGNLIVTNCHSSGPWAAPHPVDGSYFFSGHGKDAKADLTKCQRCHAEPAVSGPGSNPRFNKPIGKLLNGCEICHGLYAAHPTPWSGPNSQYQTFHYSAGNISGSCTLCHGAFLDGVGGINTSGGNPGRNCLDCHAETKAFNLDCAACHGFPPDGVTSEPLVGGSLVNHDNLLNAISVNVASGSAGNSHDTCLVCHGVKATGLSSGGLSPAAGYRLFDPLTDIPGDHWDGQINMNGPSGTGSGYNPDNFGCDNALCHENDGNHQLSDSQFSVQFGDFGTGFAPHPLDGSFLAGADHGPVAKSDLAGCKVCHGEETETDPKFNLGIGKAGGNGCESCHNTGTAHPSPDAPDGIDWYDVNWRHTTSHISASTCGMCHIGAGWTGSLGPACTSCHVSDPTYVSIGSCTSCHGNPPGGSSRPNRIGNHDGEHAYWACTTCHTNEGPGSAQHFTRPNSDYSRADLRAAPYGVTPYGANMTITVTPDNVTCTGICHEYHGEGDDSKTWY